MGSSERTDVPFRSILTGPEGDEPPTNVYVTEPGLDDSVRPEDGMSSPKANAGINANGAAAAIVASSRQSWRSGNNVIILPLYDLDMIGLNLKLRVTGKRLKTPEIKAFLPAFFLSVDSPLFVSLRDSSKFKQKNQEQFLGN